MKRPPHLPLTPTERHELRTAGLRLADLATHQADDVNRLTGWPLERCQFLVAMSAFQTLGSIGPRSAMDLWQLGYRAISDLRGANPVQMYERFGRITGSRVDPCVEDVFRCAVAQAEDPHLAEAYRQWWAWTKLRGTDKTSL